MLSLAPMLIVSWTTGSAHARDPSCPDLFVSQFTALLAQVDEAYLERKFDSAGALLEAAESRVPCIVEIVPTAEVARFAIRRSYGLALELDTNEARRWAQLARSLDPELSWPAYIPPDHEVRDLLMGLDEVSSLPLRGKGLVTPERGGVFLDGRFLVRPEAEPGVPHLLQVGDAGGAIGVAMWQDGTAFPDALLGPPTANAPTLPEWYGKVIDAPPKPKTAWSPARRRRLESAAGFAVAGGALYASALLSSNAYERRPTDGLFYTVNGATLASGAAGGAAVVFLGTALFGK